MNYQYADAYLEIMCSPSNYKDSPQQLKRIKKSIIKGFSQIKYDGTDFVRIWVESDSFYFHGTMDDFDKAYKTVYI